MGGISEGVGDPSPPKKMYKKIFILFRCKQMYKNEMCTTRERLVLLFVLLHRAKTGACTVGCPSKLFFLFVTGIVKITNEASYKMFVF